MHDDRLHDVRRFSDVISTAVKTYKRLGCISDLQAAINLNTVDDKLPHSLCIKWKEYRRDKELKHANLQDFEKWIEVQAEVHDGFGPRTRKQRFFPPESERENTLVGTIVFSAVTPSSMGGNASGGSPRSNQSGQFTLPPCVNGDVKKHKLPNCPRFKEFSVQERLAKVKGHGLCFRCFGRHWANKCRFNK